MSLLLCIFQIEFIKKYRRNNLYLFPTSVIIFEIICKIRAIKILNNGTLTSQICKLQSSWHASRGKWDEALDHISNEVVPFNVGEHKRFWFHRGLQEFGINKTGINMTEEVFKGIFIIFLYILSVSSTSWSVCSKYLGEGFVSSFTQ